MKLLIPLFLLVLFTELPLYYFALGMPVEERANILNALIALITLFLNPVYIVSGASHIARSWDITVFEISMLGGWRKIAVARIVSIVIYVAPYVVLQSIIVNLFSTTLQLDHLITVYMALSIYLYTGLTLLLSLVKSRTATLLTSATALFIAPISIVVLAGNYIMFNMNLDPATSAISYIFNPMLTYWYSITHPGFTQLNWLHSIVIDTATTICLYTLFILLFERSEMKV